MSQKVDYSKSIIYKLCCKNPLITDIYIGSTTNFKCRKNRHKYCCNVEDNKSYNCNVYEFIRNNGGFQNWDMIMVEEYCCENKKQLETRERHWIEELKSSLNRNVPTRTQSERYQKNKEQIEINRKLYREKNKEQIKKKTKEYREKNKDKIKSLEKEKIICECGKEITRGAKYNHLRSKTHLKIMKEKC